MAEMKSEPVYVLDAEYELWKLYKVVSSTYPHGLTQAICLSNSEKQAWAFEMSGPFTVMLPGELTTSRALLDRVAEAETPRVN